MNLNRKGFMLAEVTIVAAIAVAIIVSMYTSSSRMIDAYETRENYYDVDTIYATGHIYNYLIDSLKLNYYISASENVFIIQDGNEVTDKYINKIRDEYNLNQVILISGSEIEELVSDINLNKTMRNYLKNFVLNNIDDDKFYLITERKVTKVDNSSKYNYYYYYVEV